MQYYRLILAILAQFFCSQHSAFATSLTEREELTLSLNQLNQIEASLNRAQQSARTGINERYYFDYPRIHGDITTLRSGIDNYLTPPVPNREIQQRSSDNTGRRKPRHEPRTNQRLPGCQPDEARCCQPGDARPVQRLSAAVGGLDAEISRKSVGAGAELLLLAPAEAGGG